MRMCGIWFRLLTFLFLHWYSDIKGQHKSDILSRKYPPDKLKVDLELFRDVVLRMHPGVGLYQSKSYYEELFREKISNLRDSLSEKNFRILCKLLVEELHCGHTEVLGSKPYNKAISKAELNFSPYLFLPVEEQLYVIANLSKKQDSVIPKGAEVKRLNGIACDSILKHCRRFISTDGFNPASKFHYLQLGFNNLYPSLFGRPDSLTVEYRIGKTIQSHHYGSLKLKQLPALPLKKLEDSLYRGSKRSGIKQREIDSAKILILRLERFSHSRYKANYRKIFRKLEKNPETRLVLDLRGNGGGSLANAYKLLSYLIDSAKTQTLYTRIKNYPYKKHTRGNLSFRFTRFVFSMIGKKQVQHDTDFYVYTIKPNKKHRYSGQLFVLMNGGSFSASCLVGAYLKKRKATVFIGSESGGTAEGCNAGITPYYTLPNTGIRLRIPAFRVMHDVQPKLSGRGLVPDYEINYDFRDIVSRKDLEIQKVLELLNKLR